MINIRIAVLLRITTLLICSSATTAILADRYCGIYSVYAAAKALDCHPEFEALLETEYVSGFYGSTVSDICAAVRSTGLKSQVYEQMSFNSLKSCNLPVILHTRSDGQINMYNHWLLFLGESNGQVRIADGKDGIFEISVAELLSKWDGVGIVVYDQSPAHSISQLESRLWIKLIAACLFLIVVLDVLVRKVEYSKRGRLVFIFLLVIGVGLIRHSVSEDGFFRNHSVLTEVLAVGGNLDIEEVNYDEAVAGTKEVLFIDARYPSDFAKGTISGALSIPVDASDRELRKAISTIDKNRNIVVFCQSRDCAFDKTMAVRLKGLGCKTVRTLCGGWLEWKESNVR